MKHIFTTFICLALLYPAFGQNETNTVPEIPEPVTYKKDTSEVRMNGKKIIIIKDQEIESGTEKHTSSSTTISMWSSRRNRVWQGFEIGFTGVSYTEEFNTDIPPGLEFFDPIVSNSINWAINPFEVDMRIVGEYVKFSTGLGYMAKNFSLANNYRLTKDSDGITTGFQDHRVTMVRNRFRTGYITAPAMIHFNTNKNPSHAFRIGAGVVGGVKIFEAYRVKHYYDGHKTREKYNGGYNANPFLLDLRAVVGYGGVNLYATYSTQGLFKDNRGPEVYPFTVGISFVNSY
ncbi:outer membrane beta-barrel protein [bacterium SCSIO 12643]|nr:outer membrane beta-barrel protein [bacterium SCSIO 12643]